MLFRSALTKLLGQGSLFFLVAATATGCGGCNDPTLQCDASGDNCVICDGYGCRPADTDPGAGGAGQGGAGQGSGGAAAACDPSLAACPCVGDDACEAGTQCIGGLCIAGCDYSYECGEGRVCADGQCAPGCSDVSPCVEPGTVCDRGVCVVDPANPVCTDAKPCAGDTEICVGGLCAVACKTNADCKDGEVCNAGTGACIVDPSPQPGCGASTCAALGQRCMADGYCHYPCVDLAACQHIDSRFVACEASICKTREEVAPDCTLDDPCPEGESCISNKCL